MFVVAGGDPPGGAVAAAGRVHPRPRRRHHRHLDARYVHRLQPAARHVLRRPVPGVRRRGGRHRLRRGRRPGPAGTTLGRPSAGTPRTGRGARFGREPGRRLQRPHRPERPRAAAGDPHRPGPGRPGPRRYQRRRSTQHRLHPRRPHRGTGTPGHLRSGPSGRATFPAGIGEVQHRPHPGRRRRRRRHQDGHGDEPRHAATNPPHRRTLTPHRLEHRPAPAADGIPALAAHRHSPPRRRLRVRDQWYERAPDPGRGTRRTRLHSRSPNTRRDAADAAVGAW